MTFKKANSEHIEWDQFIFKNNGSFLQSYWWGEFQESLGRKTWQIDLGELKALIVKHNLPFKKNYFYCPKGPVIDESAISKKALVNSFFKEVGQIAKKEKSIFLKIEPEENLFKENKKLRLSKNIQPKKTIILDINRPINDIYGSFHKKTRYSIRIAQEKGVIVEKAAKDDRQSTAFFLKLLNQTAKRDNFSLYPGEYYEKMIEILGERDIARLYLAKANDKIVSASIIVFFGEVAAYLHSASDYNFRHLMAPHLLQWEVIKEAKELGFKYYDFWGIDEKKMPGVARFKKRFNGKEVKYPSAYDAVFQKGWYWLYNLAKKIQVLFL